MKLRTLASFDAYKEGLSWPWLAFAASGSQAAFADSPRSFATRELAGEAVTSGPSRSLPDGVTLADVRGFSLSKDDEIAASTATHLHLLASPRSVALADLLNDADLQPRAVLFARDGKALWISAEATGATLLVLIDLSTLTVRGISRTAALPGPATHELYLHPHDDAVLLLAACGEAGTFARIAGFAGGEVSTIATALDEGGLAAGFVGFSADGARVHLAEPDELRTHSWPGLLELSSIELADDFVASYSGALVHGRVLVDGHEAESGDDAVMSFDVSATLGSWLLPPFPAGMWAGRLGSTSLVTIEPHGNPAHADIVLIEKL